MSVALRPNTKRRSAGWRSASTSQINLGYDFDAHRASGAANSLRCCLNRGRVHVRHLLGGDLADLLLSHLAQLLLVRSARSLGDTGSLEQKHRSRRRVGEDGEGAAGVDTDDDRDGESGQVGRL